MQSQPLDLSRKRPLLKKEGEEAGHPKFPKQDTFELQSQPLDLSTKSRKITGGASSFSIISDRSTWGNRFKFNTRVVEFAMNRSISHNMDDALKNFIQDLVDNDSVIYSATSEENNRLLVRHKGDLLGQLKDETGVTFDQHPQIPEKIQTTLPIPEELKNETSLDDEFDLDEERPEINNTFYDADATASTVYRSPIAVPPNVPKRRRKGTQSKRSLDATLKQGP
ncbi:hypothetical protein QR680_017252 [Steinernema hermaphroditum]|uniref:Uncharacterized protein n=1 Tax=Steinernema hermaphroditum TaxID=289476 RepID=A0AA39HDW0_9BILA|nr:hypothetical protein QR680_017252 [Steinernema hermaphroditum]